jgi:hypothetical protein
MESSGWLIAVSGQAMCHHVYYLYFSALVVSARLKVIVTAVSCWIDNDIVDLTMVDFRHREHLDSDAL